ncbi:iron-siderophore ABC transporter substrate-binding protein [Actinospica durhamensis]|uniref:Iron-siderophore ABC transporter substrate-binding protein n=1 Tax=Actinospica durhamensis TaxID=1508375 RepID=A0A941IPQ0_9ACTN|nr:iron-siderophore ABC transporter substrate-binding protein [Actinospica durhamensis]MBR7836790.1 iron-siderophore ABC transporter substrate-binding protein [Actinospica durhamensis]
MNRLILSAAAAAASLLALSACGSTDVAADTAASASSSAGPVTLTDATGTKVVLEHPATRVVSTEWVVTEDLISLGVQQVGAADVADYKVYDTDVPLTGDVTDIGLRGEPSMDTVASLSPDLIIATTDLTASVIKQLRAIAPTLVVNPANGADQIGQMTTDLDLIAQATGRTAQAATVEKTFETTLATGKKALAAAGLAGTKVAVADSYTVSNQVTVRPYTSTSLFGAVDKELGLVDAWDVTGDKSYGLGSTDVEGLTKLGDVPLVYENSGEDPFTVELAGNAVWKNLPFVKDGKVTRLPDGIWPFGGPGSMDAYIDALVNALTK